MEVSREIDPASQGYSSRGRAPVIGLSPAWGTARGNSTSRSGVRARRGAAYISDMDPSSRRDLWQAVLDRKETAPPFVYAVSTTGIFCRPSCPSRRPNPENVTFFEGPDAARRAGYRACKRCGPDDLDASRHDHDRVLLACRIIEQRGGPVPLAELAAATGWTTRSVQRHFSDLLGTSPSAYASTVRTSHARKVLRGDGSVTEAMYRAGYGSSRAFYQEAGSRLGVAPSVFAAGSPGTTLRWAVTQTQVGPAVVVASDRGLCAVRLGDPQENLRLLAAEFPLAEFEHSEDRLGPVCEAVATISRGADPGMSLPLDVRATAFEARVWSAVVRIPVGEIRSYSQLAAEVDAPKAVRAVASAIGRNPVAMVIPCHRVVRADGSLGGYRWGLRIKAELLAAERQR